MDCESLVTKKYVLKVITNLIISVFKFMKTSIISYQVNQENIFGNSLSISTSDVIQIEKQVWLYSPAVVGLC